MKIVVWFLLLTCSVAAQVRGVAHLSAYVGGVSEVSAGRYVYQPDYGIAAESLVQLDTDVSTPFADQSYYSSITRMPMNLGGVMVTVAGVPSKLFGVTPTQIVFQVPRPMVRSVHDEGVYIEVVAEGKTWPFWARYKSASPGLYLGPLSDGVYFATGGYRVGDGAPTQITSAPIPVSGAFIPVVMSLYGTGWRFASEVVIVVNGQRITPYGWGKYPTFIGQDWVACIVPANLAGAGLVQCQIVADGTVSNTVWLRF